MQEHELSKKNISLISYYIYKKK